MVSSGHNERSRNVDAAERSHPLHRLGTAGHECQTAQSADVQASSSGSRSAGQTSGSLSQGHGQGQVQNERTEEVMNVLDKVSLREHMLRLAMDNTGTMCHANSSMMCYMSACLSRKDFLCADWEALSDDLCRMLVNARAQLVKLDDMPWFHDFIATWNDQHAQADSAEFTYHLLTRVGTPVVSNAWTRMVLMGEKAITHDSGASFQPITLQLDPSMIEHDEIQLETLLRLWSNDMGMTAGLCQPQDLLVLHLDRFVQTLSGKVRKLNTAVRFCWAIQVPILSSGATCRWDSFQLIAAFSHLGGTTGGHYQAILRTFPEVTDLCSPTTWLFCDDKCHPARCWAFPPQFEEGATCFLDLQI